jgi:hypothetical protein
VCALDVAAAPAQVEADVAALGPSELPQALPECLDPRLSLRIALGGVHQRRDAAHTVSLLRLRGARPGRRSGCRRAAKQRNEIASSHCLSQG